MTIHDLDMADGLGEEPVLVSASAAAWWTRPLRQYEDYDTVMVQMQTASGKQSHINNCREAVYGYDQRIEVFGSNGMLTQDNLRPTTIRVTRAEATEAREPLLNFFLERYAQAYRSEMEAFIDALAARKSRCRPPCATALWPFVFAECAVQSVADRPQHYGLRGSR